MEKTLVFCLFANGLHILDPEPVFHRVSDQRSQTCAEEKISGVENAVDRAE